MFQYFLLSPITHSSSVIERKEREMKKIIFIIFLVSISCFISFLILEFGYRFYLFGFKFYYEDEMIIDEAIMDKKKPNVFFVGDSFTQGIPYRLFLTFPNILDRRLKDLKITNFGLVDTDIPDQLNIIKQISELNPSLIVWGLSTNDVCMPPPKVKPLKSFSTERSSRAWRNILFELPYDCLINKKMSLFSTFKEILYNYSYVYIVIKGRLQNIKSLSFLRDELTPEEYFDKDTIEEMLLYGQDEGRMLCFREGYCPEHIFKAALEMRDFLYNKGIDLILLYVPQEADIDQDVFERNIRGNIELDRMNLRDCIRRFCSQNDIRFLDPSADLAKSDQGLFLLNRHYNLKGHAIMADFLEDNLYENFRPKRQIIR